MMAKDPDPAASASAGARQQISAATPMRHPAMALTRRRRLRRSLWSLAAVATAGSAMVMTAGVASAGTHHHAGYRQVNLVSDIPGLAAKTDSDLVNSWGVSTSPGTGQAPGSALWVSDNAASKTTLYSAGTATTVTKSGLVVTITSGAPTGQVFNADTSPSDFVLRDGAGNSGPAAFIFASENGGIDGWNPRVGVTSSGPPATVTETPVANGANAVYKGLVMAQASDGKTYLYATNFRSGRVEAYDSDFKPVELPGGLFVDHRMPGGYAPFGIQEVDGKLYVTYAKQDSGLKDDAAGPGHGFVDVFTNDGALVRRLVTRGALNSPWGLALAPASFGRFGGALLVGNFGDGHINAYNPVTGAHLGQLHRPDSRPIAIEGLWSLRFGNGNAAGTNELIFSSGPGDEAHGLLGKIVVGG
jgi:uncharacterized protein (TIGR03118 family)